MAQTLGCLVASMTTCAILLHWGQPGPERAEAAPAIELIANSITQPWQGIRVDPARSDGRIDPPGTHFFVDREGRWSATEAWQKQGQLKQKGVVHITLQPSAGTNKITPAQWETTQKLMALLLTTCKIPNDRNHIVFNEALVVPAAPRKGSETAAKSPARQVESARSR
jgi:hypothetical protein